MESFSLLKYWRGGGGAALAAAAATAASSMRTTASTTTTTIASSVLDPSAETDDDGGGDVSDDGPFFDLEFAVPEEDGEGEEEEDGEEKDSSTAAMEAESDDNEEREFNFMVSSEGSCGGDLQTDPLSPSDDLFFKGKLVPLEPSSIVITSSEADPKPQFAVSLLKSATKFRVFMLGLRKAKSTTAEPNGAPAASTAAAASPKQQSQSQQSRFFIKHSPPLQCQTNIRLLSLASAAFCLLAIATFLSGHRRNPLPPAFFHSDQTCLMDNITFLDKK